VDTGLGRTLVGNDWWILTLFSQHWGRAANTFLYLLLNKFFLFQCLYLTGH
jgi:hypothetical protein